MVEVGEHEAKTMLSALLRRVAAGEEITIISSGEPVARLIPVRSGEERVFGQDEGLFEVPEEGLWHMRLLCPIPSPGPGCRRYPGGSTSDKVFEQHDVPLLLAD